MMTRTNLLKAGLLSVFCVGLIACSEDNPDSPETGPTDLYMSPTVPDGRIVLVKNNTRRQPYIGAGYDIMGDYLENRSVKQQILDLSKFEMDQIDSLAFRQSCSKNYEGRNGTELLKSIMTKNDFKLTGDNNSDLLFTGTLTESEWIYQSPYDYSDQYTFICNQYDNTAMRVSILVLSAKRLALYLGDEFKEDIRVLTPQDIIDTYGTHLIRRAHLGIRIRNLYRSVVAGSKEECLSAASYGAEARRQEIYKLYSDQDMPTEAVAKNYGEAIITEFNGGDMGKLPLLTLTPNEVIGEPMDILAWQHSMDVSNYSLTTLSGEDLIPIYELIEDKAISDKLKEATVAYIKAGQLSVLKNHPLLQARKENRYRYFKSVDDFSANAGEGYQLEGVIGSLFDSQQPGTSALYLYSNDKTDYLSFDSTLAQEMNMTLKGEIGHCYADWQNGLDTLFEISDGKNYSYTLEDKNKYGENGTWKKTGKEVYMKKVSN